MTEWTIVTVLIAIIGLFFTVGKPIINLNTTIVKLQATVENLMKEVETFKSSNSKSHEKIFSQLDDHENRISKLEVLNEKDN